MTFEVHNGPLSLLFLLTVAVTVAVLVVMIFPKTR